VAQQAVGAAAQQLAMLRETAGAEGQVQQQQRAGRLLQKRSITRQRPASNSKRPPRSRVLHTSTALHVLEPAAACMCSCRCENEPYVHSFVAADFLLHA
jgi:hypothetical protein